MRQSLPGYLRLKPVRLILIVCGFGCAGESSQEFAKKESPASASGSSTIAPIPPTHVSSPEHVQDSAPISADTSRDCQAQGIGDEETFARTVCVVASDFGFRAQLVHSYGAGGVDVFISEADARKLASNREELRRKTTALTAWAKRNYTAFNAVDVTIVGDSKIARGSKIGSGPTTVELYRN